MKNMNSSDLWWECDHCRAVFRADNNLCISCGSPTHEYRKQGMGIFSGVEGLTTASVASFVYNTGYYNVAS